MDSLMCQDPLHAVMVRSEVPHGIVRGIDASAARDMPGVRLILTGGAAADWGTSERTVPVGADATAMLFDTPASYPLAIGKVRCVGEPIALVVAVTRAEAIAAAAKVTVNILELPALWEPRESAQLDAFQLYECLPGNSLLRTYSGEYESTVQAFAEAAHVACLRFVGRRAVPTERRRVVSTYDDIGGCWELAGALGDDAELARDYASLLHASKILGRPIACMDEGAGSFARGREICDFDFDGELALDRDGRFLALRQTGFVNAGTGVGSDERLAGLTHGTHVLGVAYDIPFVEVRRHAIATTVAQRCLLSGSFLPEPNLFVERLIETAAREMKLDSVMLRKKNLSGSAEPFRHVGKDAGECGSVGASFTEALASADLGGVGAREAAVAGRGRLHGLGMGNYCDGETPCSSCVVEVEVEPSTGTFKVIKYSHAGGGVSAARASVPPQSDDGDIVNRVEAAPALLNAVVGALGGRHIDAPATAAGIRQALKAPPTMLGLY